jgi:hypothetical protein
MFYLHNSTFLQCTNKNVPARFEVLKAVLLRFISSGILLCDFDIQRTVHRDMFLLYNQRNALFLRFIFDKELYMFQPG